MTSAAAMVDAPSLAGRPAPPKGQGAGRGRGAGRHGWERRSVARAAGRRGGPSGGTFAGLGWPRGRRARMCPPGDRAPPGAPPGAARPIPPPHRVASCFQTAADPRRGRPSGARCHRQWGGDALGALPPPPPPPMRLASPLRSARLPRRYAARVRVDAPLHSSRRSSDPEACPVIFAYPSVYETVYLGTVYGIVAAENPETLLGHGIPGP